MQVAAMLAAVLTSRRGVVYVAMGNHRKLAHISFQKKEDLC